MGPHEQHASGASPAATAPYPAGLWSVASLALLAPATATRVPPCLSASYENRRWRPVEWFRGLHSLRESRPRPPVPMGATAGFVQQCERRSTHILALKGKDAAWPLRCAAMAPRDDIHPPRRRTVMTTPWLAFRTMLGPVPACSNFPLPHGRGSYHLDHDPRTSLRKFKPRASDSLRNTRRSSPAPPETRQGIPSRQIASASSPFRNLQRG